MESWNSWQDFIPLFKPYTLPMSHWGCIDLEIHVLLHYSFGLWTLSQRVLGLRLSYRTAVKLLYIAIHIIQNLYTLIYGSGTWLGGGGTIWCDSIVNCFAGNNHQTLPLLASPQWWFTEFRMCVWHITSYLCFLIASSVSKPCRPFLDHVLDN